LEHPDPMPSAHAVLEWSVGRGASNRSRQTCRAGSNLRRTEQGAEAVKYQGSRMRTMEHFFLSAGLMLGLMVSCSFADALDNWQWRYPLPEGNPLQAVTFANGTFVAVGQAGTIL